MVVMRFSCGVCINSKFCVLSFNNDSFKLLGKIQNPSCFIKYVTWNYSKLFDCNSKDVLYYLTCNNCDYFYLGKIIDFKQRIHKHKSDVKHPQNSACRECAEHLRDCAKIEPFFWIYLFYHEKDHYLRGYKKNWFIIKWKPPLNINKTWLFYYFIFKDYLLDNRNNFLFL